ncbi:hypothetical protein [Infirmifilum sp. NZ]|uniref:hypothetical protein n=1 Tax=Infirmifilum sp. NZ TaxID=2926850 RepID=UPI0027A18089|nr:hypothetical protein [Infirmifilum sp. NZ]UNQ73131.1 hypothetical protein MOV14_08460 [Infirmifilum sp. NZ]
MSKLHHAALGLILCAGLLLHLLPYLITGEPFSTDVWPLIRASERIASNSSLRIWDDRAFDGYNNRWPGVILASAMFSLVSGVGVELTYSFSLLVASLLSSSLMLGAFAKRIIGRGGLAEALPAVWLFYPSVAVFASSLLKEVYAYPFLFALLLLTTRGSRRDVLVATVLMGALVLSHHLASIMAFSLFLSLAVVCTGLKAIGYYRKPCPIRPVRSIVLGLLTGGFFLLYYTAYGGAGLRLRLGFADAAMLALYACYLTLGVVVYLRFSRVGYVEGLVGVLVLLLLLFSSRTPAVVGLSVNYGELLPYVAPAFAPFIFLVSRKLPRRELLAAVYALSLPPSVFSLYVLFAKPELASMLHRFLNYFSLPAGVLACVLSSAGRRVIRAGVALSLLLLALSAFSLVTLSSFGGGPAFYWRYSEAEVESLKGVLGLVRGGVLGGDDKVSYFCASVLRVDTGSVLAYSYAGRALPTGFPSVVLRDYFSKGYVSGLSVYPVEPFLSSLPRFSRLFDSGEVFVVAGG